MVELYKPERAELFFRQGLIADKATMSYNARWGGAIDWPEEKWDAWARKWMYSDEKSYFYRYIRTQDGTFVGEAAWRFEEEYGMHVISLIVKHDQRGKGYGAQALHLLLQEAKKRGILRLCDDIAADNPSIAMFLNMGFQEIRRTEQVVMLAIELKEEATCR